MMVKLFHVLPQTRDFLVYNAISKLSLNYSLFLFLAKLSDAELPHQQKIKKKLVDSYLIIVFSILQELFPADIDNLDDIVSNSSQNGNVFKRLYRFSKRKVTRSSSFAIEKFTDGVELTRKDSFVVSGNDEFLSGSTDNQPKDPVLHQEQGEITSPEKT